MAHWIYSGQENDTCDIYHPGNNLPNPPDVAGVKIYVIPRFRNIKSNFNGLFTYSHIILMPLNTDVRDNYPSGVGDTLYLPNATQAGADLGVMFVCRRRMTGGLPDYLEVYALATSWTYPTNEG